MGGDSRPAQFIVKSGVDLRQDLAILSQQGSGKSKVSLFQGLTF